MTRVPPTAVLALAVCMALAASAPALAETSGSEPRAKKNCGKADIGYTRASVRSRNVGCRTAREVVRRFVDKHPGREAEECVLRACRVKRRFFCTFGDKPGVAVLRCSNPKRQNHDLVARWGD